MRLKKSVEADLRQASKNKDIDVADGHLVLPIAFIATLQVVAFS